MAKAGKKKVAPGDVATNRQARHRYEIVEKIECGIELQGTEVKALREGAVQIKDSYAQVWEGEMWLHNCHISPYAPAAANNHEPERVRKLLAKRVEIQRLAGALSQKGLTLVPLRIYFKGQHAKVELGLAKGRDRFDKRQAIKERETKRDIDRALREANR